MKSFRLSPLMIFLIILATLLVGYVLTHMWKNLQASVTEGFATEDGIPLTGYSTSDTKVVPIVPDLLYFDPVNKALINKPSGSDVLYIKTTGGTDMSFNLAAAGGYTVIDAGFGDISYNSTGPTLTPSAAITEHTTVGAAKTYFSGLAGDSVIYMDVDLSNNRSTSPPDDTTVIKSLRTYSDSAQKVSVSTVNYPVLTGTSSNYDKRKYYRLSRAFNVANLATADPVKYTFTTTTDDRYAVVHIPVATTRVIFLHVIDLTYKQHAETFYFNSATTEVASIRIGKDIFDKTVKTAPASLAEVNGTSVTPLTMTTSTDVDFDVALKYDETSKTVHVMGSKKEAVGRTQFYTILSFPTNTKVSINFSSTTIGNSTFSPTDVSQNTLGDLTSTLEQLKLLKDFFGSSSSDYLLKTEVVPPVCPSCPSCPGGGVCNTCGGNGGSGTNTGSDTKKDITSNELAKDFGTGATNLLRDGASGTNDLIRDGVGGATKIAKNSVSGVGSFAKDSASGIGDFAKDVAGGAALGTAVAVGGAYGIGRDAVGGVYNAATDAVSGTVGLGREIISGTTGMLNRQGQGQGQGYSQGQGQGPNMSMGGYQNSYGGQNSYPQPPSTVGQDPYSYFGAVPPRTGSSSNYMPRTADFSHFGR